MRGSGQDDKVVGHHCQPLSELVAPGLLDLVTPAARALGVGAALVGLVDDHEIPALLPDALPHVFLLGIVKRRDDVRLALPEVQQLLLVVAGMNDLEALAEESQKLILPLDGQWCRYDDEHALD